MYVHIKKKFKKENKKTKIIHLKCIFKKPNLKLQIWNTCTWKKNLNDGWEPIQVQNSRISWVKETL